MCHPRPFKNSLTGHGGSSWTLPCHIRWRPWCVRQRRGDIPWRRSTWSSRWRSWQMSWSSLRAVRSCPAARPKAASCSSHGSELSWTLEWWKPGIGNTLSKLDSGCSSFVPNGLLLTPEIHGSNPVTGKSLFRTFIFCLKDNNNRMMGGNGPNDKTLSKILTINVSPHLCQMGCFWHQKSTVPIQSLAKSYTEHLFSVKKTIIIEWWVGMAPMTKLCRNYEQ